MRAEPVTTEPMAAEQRARFDRDGYLTIRGALRPDEVAGAREAIGRVYADAATAGSLGAEGSMYLLSAVTNCPDIACLTDYPATAGALGLLGGVTGIAGAVIVGVA